MTPMDIDTATSARERLYRQVAACPECGGAIDALADEWCCDACDARFPRGTTAFLVAHPLAHDHAIHGKFGGRPWWKELLEAPSLSHNSRTQALGELVASDAGPVLDLGSGFRRLGEQVLNCEVAEYANVDIVSGGPRLPIRDESISLVICQAVLEHVPDPAAVVAEIHRVLRPGGRCYAEIPFLQAYHADPDDYQRYTYQGMRRLWRDFEIVDEGVCVGPCSALAWQLREIGLVALRRGRARVAVQHALGWLLWPVAQLDRVVACLPEARRAAGGLYVLAQRPIST